VLIGFPCTATTTAAAATTAAAGGSFINAHCRREKSSGLISSSIAYANIRAEYAYMMAKV